MENGKQSVKILPLSPRGCILKKKRNNCNCNIVISGCLKIKWTVGNNGQKMDPWSIIPNHNCYFSDKHENGTTWCTLVLLCHCITSWKVRLSAVCRKIVLCFVPKRKGRKPTVTPLSQLPQIYPDLKQEEIQLLVPSAPPTYNPCLWWSSDVSLASKASLGTSEAYSEAHG